MIYKDKKYGNIDLDSEEIPAKVKRNITFTRILSIIVGIYGIYYILSQGMMGVIYIALAIFSFIITPLKMKKDYHNARKKVLKKVETGEIDLGAIAAKEAKAKAEKEWNERERRMRCNVCGNVFCYTYSDIKANNSQSALAALSAVGTIASAVGGTRYDMYEQNKNLDRQSGKVKDFSRCPHCNSTDIVEMLPNEKMPRKTNQLGSIEELKNYKELLDLDVITQEEFDAKKKQLLGM